jgi:hypothetical protein
MAKLSMLLYDEFKAIEDYAKKHADSSAEHYKSRNQSIDRIFLQCLNGKLAEFFCYYSMKEVGYILENKPDLTILSPENKSHDADLICLGRFKEIYDNPKYIHIKSVSFENYNKYGTSFLIEKNNPTVLNPHPDHFYSIMLQCNNSFASYKFHRWICSTDIEWKPPRMNLPTKLAAYLD